MSKAPKALAWVVIGEERSGLFQALEVNLTREVSFGMIVCVRRLGLEPDSFDLGLWLCHEFPNCFENDPELTVLFLFQFIESSGKSLVRADHLSKLNKCSHNGNIYLDGSLAMQHA
ncbi:MAG: hypothetical protein WCH20_12950 [Nitrospira sp.]|jgi:hypothetical protein